MVFSKKTPKATLPTMHIRCERCQAEYDLDDGQVRGGTDVQCSVCGNVFAVGARRTQASMTRRRSSPQAMAVSVPNDDYRGSDVHFPSVAGDTAEAASHEHTHGALKIFVCLTVAAGVAFAGIQWQRGRIHSATIAAKTSAGSSASTNRPVARPPEATQDLSAESATSQAPGQKPTPSPVKKGPVVEALPSPAHAQTEDAVEEPAPPKAAASHPESYEKLIASGDRTLENGSNSKAKALYQKALHMRPSGPDALTGLAFVALDRGQIPAAYELFKRALTAKASFGPALFGMAEIHRARGEKALAVQSYQRYLQVSPNGKEARAARRQVEVLQTRR
jgi:predicted Zn finger-like uncharacterized protein